MLAPALVTLRKGDTHIVEARSPQVLPLLFIGRDTWLLLGG